MTMTRKAQARRAIYGIRNSWSLAPHRGMETDKEYEVLLEIQGDNNIGYNLVMSPEGFFAADYWYATEDDALDAAGELFGVSQDAWSAPERLR